LLSNLVCSLIEHGRIKTTLGKAKALRPVVLIRPCSIKLHTRLDNKERRCAAVRFNFDLLLRCLIGNVLLSYRVWEIRD